MRKIALLAASAALAAFAFAAPAMASAGHHRIAPRACTNHDTQLNYNADLAFNQLSEYAQIKISSNSGTDWCWVNQGTYQGQTVAWYQEGGTGCYHWDSSSNLLDIAPCVSGPGEDFYKIGNQIYNEAGNMAGTPCVYVPSLSSGANLKLGGCASSIYNSWTTPTV